MSIGDRTPTRLGKASSLLLLALLSCLQRANCSTGDLFDYQWNYGTAHNYELRAVTYGNGKFVAVGLAGTILVSVDGTNWNNQSARIGNLIYGINYDSETFVAEGNSVTLIHNVTNRGVFGSNPLSTPSFHAVVCGGNQFVAVGDHGQIVSSPDGITLTLRSGAIGNVKLLGMAWGQGKFVTVGESGTILTSEDGVSWTRQSSGTSHRLRAVAFGKNRFVIVGDANTLLYSQDGGQWTRTTPPQPRGFNSFNTVAFGNDIFLSAVFPEQDHVFTSSDGLTWSEAGKLPDVPSGLAFGAGKFVSVGRAGLHFVSTDGTAWIENQYPGFRLWFESVCYGKGLFVAVGNSIAATSVDGSNWNFRPNMPPSRIIVGFQLDRDSILPAGKGGPLLLSTNGIVWVSSAPRPVSGNVYGNPTFSVGSSRRPGLDREVVVLHSTDGVHWRKIGRLESQVPGTVASNSIGGRHVEPFKDFGVISRPAIRASDGAFEFSIVGESDRVYRIQASTDLINWVDLGVFTNTTIARRLIDTDATNYSRRFYRAISP